MSDPSNLKVAVEDENIDLGMKSMFLDNVYSRTYSTRLRNLIDSVRSGTKDPEVLRWYLSGRGKEDPEFIGDRTIFKIIHEDLYNYTLSRFKNSRLDENGKVFDDSMEVFEQLKQKLSAIEKDIEEIPEPTEIAEVYLSELENLFLTLEKIQYISNPEGALKIINHFKSEQEKMLTKLKAILEIVPGSEGMYILPNGRKFSREQVDELIKESERKLSTYDEALLNAEDTRKDIAKLILGDTN